MKVLMIGDADSLWMQRYIKYVSIPLGHQVEIITNKNEKYADFYKSNNVCVHTAYKENNILFKVPKLRAAMLFLENMRLVGKIKSDIVQVQFVNYSIARIMARLNLNRKLILTYWGSDLLRGSDKQFSKATGTIEKANSIVVMTAEMKNRLLEIYGDKAKDKTQIIDMGISAFKNIDEAIKDKIGAKKKLFGENFGDKTVITLGYNASEAQQHEKLLKELQNLPSNIKNKICVLLPMTYPDNKATYIKKIQELAENIGFRVLILTEFMNDEQIATLCAATDIFVNAQTTDALSTSMLEQLYSGSLVLNGSWLHYSFLDELGVYYEKFDSIDEICSQIEKTIDNLLQSRTECNHDLLANQCSWDSCKDRWENVYNNL